MPASLISAFALSSLQGVIASVLLSCLIYYGVGFVLAYFSKKSWLKSALLLISTIAAVLFLYWITRVAISWAEVFTGYQIAEMGILRFLSSATTILAFGFLSGYGTQKLVQNREGGLKTWVYRFTGFAIVPSIVVLAIYGTNNAKTNQTKNTHAFKLTARLHVKIGSDYLNLPCRREFNVRYSNRSCTIETDPSKLNILTRTLMISPVGRREDKTICTADEDKATSDFCIVQFLPFQVDYQSPIIEWRSNRRLKIYQKNLITPKPAKTIGGLYVLHSEVTSYQDTRLDMTQYIFEKNMKMQSLISTVIIPESMTEVN